jgi:hypothetical protein
MIEQPNGDPTVRVTLGEVYRAVLRVEAGLNKHEDGHDTHARWQITTGIALIGLVVALVKLLGSLPVPAS